MLALTPARLRAFLRDVEKPAGEFGCWLWRGAINSKGYSIGFGGQLLHRVAYEWLVGPIASGLHIDHLCRVKKCVNPYHLQPVSRSENARRALEHGPFAVRRYCRRGHELTSTTARMWSNGRERLPYCLACIALRKVRHAA